MSTPTTNQPDSETRSLDLFEENNRLIGIDTLRAAERTISLLREQVEFVYMMNELDYRLPPCTITSPVGTPARTSTQRAALERSLSSRIASLQADIERQQFRAGSVGLNRRPETEALAEEQRRDLSASGRLSLTEVYRHHHLNSCLALTGSPSSSPTQHAMEREWERQLADGEVDSNGTPILLTDSQKIQPIPQILL
ncbi:hypothetical protein H4Q26_000449 [Puccinia striiformis f. sp. tritici PST-130]|nr:hypothetical protein H4Q26_000449 [Puccinia striiformis f. sp. tritici PST-130]